MPIRSLYLCYFGLREPLVQTQVVPYLRGLSRMGVQCTLLTFEPEPGRRWDDEQRRKWRDRLALDGIDWRMMTYHRRPSLPATTYDVLAGARVATSIIKEKDIQLIHARSHVAAAMGAIAARRTGARLLFDIRGFLPEEYVDSGNWKAGGLPFRLTKSVERWLYRSAHGFVVITENAKRTLAAVGVPGARPMEVIPCCVEEARFSSGVRDDRDRVRASLGLTGRLVLVYAGTLGGYYLTEELAAFIGAAKKADPATFAMILTRNPGDLREALHRHGLVEGDILITEASPDEVPQYLGAADVGLIVVRPSYARRAMSPTKAAEYLASGLPVVATAGIGDLTEHLGEARAGVIIESFDTKGYDDAVVRLQGLMHDPALADRCRDLARRRYDMDRVGAERYRRLYEAIDNARQLP